MKKITAIRQSGRHQPQARIFIDGKPALKVPAALADAEGLFVGQELEGERLDELSRAAQRVRCRDTAVRLLGVRPRSRDEMRRALAQRGFTTALIAETLSELAEWGQLDDGAFARYWAENRNAFRPRSRLLTGMELRRKGVSEEIIGRAVGDIDDAESAYRAAGVRAFKITYRDYSDFRRRLGDFLRRRGYSYEIIRETLARVWRERGDTGK